ncbi:MAG: hypothetical protein K1X74_22365 [Pirellulales bacterium]|nr:hypothetical protein [Pirellulales bacterium]
MRPKLTLLCLAYLPLLAAGGAGCPQLLDQYMVPGPELPVGPSLSDVVETVERHTVHVTSLSTTEARIKATGLPGVTAKIAYQAPRRLRLLAETALTGSEFDLGSNDERFWFWIRRSEPPALFTCRHDQYAASRAQQMLPIDPQWLIESLGLVHFDPSAAHAGPRSVPGGRLAVQSNLLRGNRVLIKVTLLDAARGLVLEQHLSDEAGNLIASAFASDHRRDPVTEVTLPHEVKLQWPSADFSLTLKVDAWTINYADDMSDALWSMPSDVAPQVIDLADPRLNAPAGARGGVRFGVDGAQ